MNQYYDIKNRSTLITRHFFRTKNGNGIDRLKCLKKSNITFTDYNKLLRRQAFKQQLLH